MKDFIDIIKNNKWTENNGFLWAEVSKEDYKELTGIDICLLEKIFSTVTYAVKLIPVEGEENQYKITWVTALNDAEYTELSGEYMVPYSEELMDIIKSKYKNQDILDLLKGSTDGISNVERVLGLIKEHFASPLMDFVTDELKEELRNADYVKLDDLDADDLPEEILDKAEDKLWNYYESSDVINKVQDYFDFRDFVKDCIDVL